MTTPTKHPGLDRVLSIEIARVTEAAAIASARWRGRGDKNSADAAAVKAMRDELAKVSIRGRVVIGEGEMDEAPMLYIGEEVGVGDGPQVDIAVDPLEGTTICAKDMPNALAVLAIMSLLSYVLFRMIEKPFIDASRVLTSVILLRRLVKKMND